MALPEAHPSFRAHFTDPVYDDRGGRCRAVRERRGLGARDGLGRSPRRARRDRRPADRPGDRRRPHRGRPDGGRRRDRDGAVPHRSRVHPPPPDRAAPGRRPRARPAGARLPDRTYGSTSGSWSSSGTTWRAGATPPDPAAREPAGPLATTSHPTAHTLTGMSLSRGATTWRCAAVDDAAHEPAGRTTLTPWTRSTRSRRLGGVARLDDLLELTTRSRIRTAEARGRVRRIASGRYALPTARPALELAARWGGYASHLCAAAELGWEIATAARAAPGRRAPAPGAPGAPRGGRGTSARGDAGRRT